MKIQFVIPGNPFGKQRPFVAHHHGIKRKKTILHENIVREAWHQAYSGKEQVGNILIKIKAFYQIPKSWPKWKKAAADMKLIRPHRKGPAKSDVDNVSKLVMDSLNPQKIRHKTIPNTGVYKDDGQVVSLAIESWYDIKPRVEVTVLAEPEQDKEAIKKKVKELSK